MKIRYTLSCDCGNERYEDATKSIFKTKWLPLFPKGIRHDKQGNLALCGACKKPVRISVINDWKLAKELNCYFEGALKNAIKDPNCAACGRIPSEMGKEPLICLPNSEIDSWQLFCCSCALDEISKKNAGIIANLWNRGDIKINHKGVQKKNGT